MIKKRSNYFIQPRTKHLPTILGILFFVSQNIYHSFLDLSSSESSRKIWLSYHQQMDNNVIVISSTEKNLTSMAMKLPIRPTNLYVPFYNDLHLASQTQLPRTWRLHLYSDKGAAKEQVDANSCFEIKSYLPFFQNKKARCLPSLYIIGFEKTGTPILNIWLSHHPNLKSRWIEGRFFDHKPEETSANLDSTWHDYLATQPTIGISQLGHTWTMEKSPAYAQNPIAPLALSSLVQSAKFLLVTRDPAQRAFSMLRMYTNHYASVVDGICGRPQSYFVKNLVTGDVRYLGDNFHDLHPLKKKTNRLPPGEGGTMVPFALAPPSSGTNDTLLKEEEEWIYLNSDPDPEDFHRYIKYAISKHNKSNRIIDNFSSKNMTNKKNLPPHHTSDSASTHLPFLQKMSDRGARILTGGLYGLYIEQWMRHFPPTSLIVIPSEDFFAPNKVVRSMTHLQQVLGLPIIDYQTLLKKNPQSNRYEMPGSIGTILNRHFNSNNVVTRSSRFDKLSSLSSNMLPQTKDLLDDFYCESNQQLKRLTNKNRYSLTKLGDYSCYNS
jgi:hypothetical protein